MVYLATHFFRFCSELHNIINAIHSKLHITYYILLTQQTNKRNNQTNNTVDVARKMWYHSSKRLTAPLLKYDDLENAIPAAARHKNPYLWLRTNKISCM